ETSLVLGSTGLTMNITGLTGNGLFPHEHPEKWMREVKPFLSEAAALGLHEQRAVGVGVGIFEKSGYTIHTDGGGRMEELYPRETLWASLLSAYGIANRYAPEGRSFGDGGAVALSGQGFRNMAAEEIARLLRERFVLLD